MAPFEPKTSNKLLRFFVFRSLNYGKSKPLLEYKEFYKHVFKIYIVFASSIFVLMGAFLIILGIKNPELTEARPYLSYLWLGIGLSPCPLVLIYILYRFIKEQAHLKNRVEMSHDVFLSKMSLSPELSSIFVEKLREMLGFVYNVSPLIIYPKDTAENLHWICPTVPLCLELLFAVANEFDIKLNEEEQDRIIDAIFDKAKTIEDVINIMAEELKPYHSGHFLGDQIN